MPETPRCFARDPLYWRHMPLKAPLVEDPSLPPYVLEYRTAEGRLLSRMVMGPKAAHRVNKTAVRDDLRSAWQTFTAAVKTRLFQK